MSNVSLPSVPGDADNREGWEPKAYRPIPFAAFRDEILALYAPPFRAKNTWLKLRQALRETGDLLPPDATTAELTPPLVSRFILARPEGSSPNTTAGLLSSLRAACAYAEAQGYLHRSPFRFRKTWIRTAPQTKTRHHGREEIARVLELLRGEKDRRIGWAGWRARRLYAMVATFAYTGIRKNEGLFLQVGDIDLAGRMLAIVPRERNRLKTERSAQPVPIPEPLAGILSEWLAHRLDAPTTAEGVPDEVAARPRGEACPWLFPNLRRSGPWVSGPSGQKPLDRVKAAGERAGVPGFTILSLRHSFATHAEHWGLSPAMLQRILRHTTVQTQKHYRHADPANIREAARRIDYGGPES